MPRVSYDPDNVDAVDDVVSIKKRAESSADRHKALMWCIREAWADEDIGCIERYETATQSGWKMYPYRG